MKYFIIPYIALGFILTLTIGIEYDFNGKEVLPTYYGSPFIFKQKSIASSMEYYYSISGILLNVLVWSFFLYFINEAIQKIIANIKQSKIIRNLYSIFIGLLMIFSTIIFYFEPVMMGRGFDKYRNYWYWNVDKGAKENGGTFDKKIIFFRL